MKMLNNTYSNPVKAMTLKFSKAIRLRRFQQVGSLLLTGILGAGLFQPAWAGDPFRSSNPEAIGDRTEAAFTALFQEGDYPKAAEALQIAQEQEGEEPLVYALNASIAFLQEDWSSLRNYGRETLTKGEGLIESSPVRGYTYVAIGEILEGAYALSPEGEGSLRGVSTAVGKLKRAYTALQKAKDINPTDPELNLIQGFMELMVSLYVPLTKPDQAIEQLENNAAPDYLANWALAIAYRDLDRYELALSALEEALQGSSNPQLYYLRAQIRIRQGLSAENQSDLIQAQSDFRRALARSSQLPKRLVGQIFREYCRNQTRIDNGARDCNALQRSILDEPGEWGPETVPEI
ncbi:MAG: Sll0314/Alr1548 family TPR repeat-containing protein [Prochlorotrichaceae cyanobacterium]